MLPAPIRGCRFQKQRVLPLNATVYRLGSSQPIANSHSPHLFGRNSSNSADRAHGSRNETGGANISSTAYPSSCFFLLQMGMLGDAEIIPAQHRIDEGLSLSRRSHSKKPFEDDFSFRHDVKSLPSPIPGIGRINIHQSSLPRGINFPPKELTSVEGQRGLYCCSKICCRHQ